MIKLWLNYKQLCASVLLYFTIQAMDHFQINRKPYSEPWLWTKSKIATHHKEIIITHQF
jgi:hypothetical protein